MREKSSSVTTAQRMNKRSYYRVLISQHQLYYVGNDDGNMAVVTGTYASNAALTPSISVSLVEIY